MSTNSIAPASHRIPGLDGLRAISILLVVFGHSRLTAPEPIASWNSLWTIIGNGQLGVRMFFVISGFLITTLLVKEQKKYGQISLKSFYARRILRIFPAFYFYIAIIACLSLTGILIVSPKDLLLAGTFTWNYGHLFFPASHGFEVLGQIWTLSMEEQFYILWPISLVAFGFKRALRIAVLIVIALPFIRVGSYFAWPASRQFMAMMLHTGSDPIMFGCIVALLAGNSRFEALVTRVNRSALPALAFLFAFFVSPFMKLYFKGVYDAPVGITLESLCLTSILLYSTRHPHSAVGAILNARIPVAIGVLSYSLYLWSALPFVTLNNTWKSTFPLNILFCFLAAAGSYLLIEKPFLRLKRHFSHPAKRPEIQVQHAEAV